MPDVKISAGADPGSVVATDKVPMARSASTTAYAATMAELATYANGAYVPNYYTGTPSMDGTGAAGTAAFVARGDHVHPSDTTRAAVTAIPGASYCDNGGFAINQRGYVSGTALAAGAFGHDRWKAGAGGCTYTFTQSGNPATTITITAGSLQQVVEGAALVGGTYTLSWTGTAQGRVGAGSYAASPVTASVTASANTTIEFSAGTVGRVKFEVGSTPTPWVANSPSVDLANCQRFYQIGYFNYAGYATAGTSISVSQTLPVAMRAAPTMTPSGGGVANVTSPTLNAAVGGGVTSNFYIGGTATISAAFVYYGFYAASADL